MANPSSNDQYLLFAIDDAAWIQAEMRRLKLPLTTPEHIYAWLVTARGGGLDWIRGSILVSNDKDRQTRLLQAFCLVHASEAAPHMLELMLSSKAPRIARDWLELHPGEASVGLLLAATGTGKLAEAALELLRRWKRQGWEAQMRLGIETLPADAGAKLRAAVLDYEDERTKFGPLEDDETPDALRAALAEAGTLKPAGVSPADLPPIVLAAATRRLRDSQMSRLRDDQMSRLLAALRNSPLPKPGAALDLAHPLVTVVKTLAEARSRDAFAWKLFQDWLADGSPAADKWKLTALGHLGTDASALKLTPFIRLWPGENQHPRAVLGLEVLQAIGTDTALMQINSVAQRAPFKVLKAAAEPAIDGIAQTRGLMRAELEDRIVPDCDLDENGTRVFDFGPRQFRFVLGPDMKPMVRDSDGKLKPDLPKPGAKDDPALAESAVAEWKLLKKQVADVAKVQAVRLEQAMVTGRRWSRDEFETLLVRHPLMTHLARLLVWGVYEPFGGGLRGTFRATEDGTYADTGEQTYTLPGGARVGLVHPLHLPEGMRAAWGELLGDYEIIAPFPQIGRPVHQLKPGEEAATALTRFQDITVSPLALAGELARRGWQRGSPEYSGGYYDHSKFFEGAQVTAVLQHNIIYVGMMAESEEQQMKECRFAPGHFAPGTTSAEAGWLPLGAVAPVVISEVLSDLTQIASKGKPV